ncbi:MAG: phosphoenolpyruvate synthase [Thermaerobacter sp.]|nr:phosphoenolpyruvate synthase [Thermaerobacter sp.]
MIKELSELRQSDAATAGGKGANLGELTATGAPVPPGFVILAEAYLRFLQDTDLAAQLDELLEGLPIEDTQELNRRAAEARRLIGSRPLPKDLAQEIRAAVGRLGKGLVAVRSSATMEDSEAASFAGINESFLNVQGEQAVLQRVQDCWASLYQPRSLYYRVRQGYSASQALIAVVVQRQIPSEKAGVMFTVDPMTGQNDRLVIEGAFGLGESVVSGQVSPDRYVVAKEGLKLLERYVARKSLRIVALPEGGTRTESLADSPLATQPVLQDGEIQHLAEVGRKIEAHYGTPQDVEWAMADRQLYVVQSRPVTTLAKPAAPAAPSGTEEQVLVRGVPASPGRAAGRARVLASLAAEADLQVGEILVTTMTSPDWVPLMKKAAAIVTDEGGATSHAAIVSRELGIPAIVGTGDATHAIPDGAEITVDASRGLVLAGRIEAPGAQPQTALTVLATAPVTATNVYVNLSQPSRIAEVAALPADGVGLLRAEFILTEALNHRHPRLLVEEGRQEEFVTRLADSLRDFAAAFHPRPVVYRASDFKTNEYRHLEGGDRFEPQEENPMLGYRGAFRYAREPELFRLELDALVRVRRDFRLPNLTLMLPFVRTTWDLEESLRVIDQVGLRNDTGFKLWIMAEVPSVLFRLADYARLGVQGVSIGSNDLTQLILGLDRDGQEVAALFDERDPAVVTALRQIICTAQDLGLTSSICGQAPSVYPEILDVVVRSGITSVSVNPDAVERTRRLVAATEQRILLEAARKSL